VAQIIYRDEQDRQDKNNMDNGITIKQPAPLVFEELTSKIIGGCFEVINELGAGFLESVYEKALLINLREKGLNISSQSPIEISYHGHNVGYFIADLLVENTVIVELKAVNMLTSEHKAQIINYLKASNINIGLLVNFGHAKLEYRRFHR
jgi:GxxExxY protein